MELAPVYLVHLLVHVCSKHMVNMQADLPIVGIQIKTDIKTVPNKIFAVLLVAQQPQFSSKKKMLRSMFLRKEQLLVPSASQLLMTLFSQ